MSFRKILLSPLNKAFCTSNTKKKKICIIGSGPAGFYFAQHFLKVLPEGIVDIYEKLPVPFGLVRYGVAPDHQEVKNVINTFTKTARLPNVKFVGNVTLGSDVSFKEFQEAYDAVVLTYGCSEDKNLNIPGEDLDNSLSARRFVGWYNGLPEDASLDPDLSTHSAVVLGQGNVAIDVARILLSDIDQLRKTDIPERCLAKLNETKIKKVYLVGRRGPLQVAYTIKEFREMTKLQGVKTLFDPSHMSNLQQYVPELARARKRLTELMIKTSSSPQKGSKDFLPIFFRKPISINGKKNPESVTFKVTSSPDPMKGVVEDTEDTDVIEGGLVLRSIGYRGTCPDPDIPWQSNTNCIDPKPGVLGAGWIGSGPVGVILSTMSNAFNQAEHLAKYLQSNSYNSNESKPGYKHIKQIIDKKGIKTVSFEGWEKIDKVEIERGIKLGKPREKITDINEMLTIGAE